MTNLRPSFSASLVCTLICGALLLLGTIFPALARDILPDAEKRAVVYNAPYISPSPGHISIISSTPLPANGAVNKGIIDGITECGFNTTFLNVSPENTKKVLLMAEEADLGVILSPKINSADALNSFVETYTNYKALRGWSFPDEPRFTQLDSLSKYFHLLERISPSKMIHMNLVGANISLFSGKSPSYPAYLDTIQRLFSPGVWSYDLYPISLKDEKKVIDYDRFYYDLEVFMALSKRTSRPFWAYCMSMPYTSKSMSRPAPTEADLRWEAFTPLAYGAQGIVYWTYSQRYSNRDETYLSALVDLEGRRTPIWYCAQKVNHEIARYDEVFADCEVIEVRHTGKALYRGTLPLKGTFGNILSISTGKEGATCSRIRNKGNEYLVIVNHTPQKSQKVKIKFATSISRLLPDSTEQSMAAHKRQTFTLTPGGYLIFRL